MATRIRVFCVTWDTQVVLKYDLCIRVVGGNLCYVGDLGTDSVDNPLLERGANRHS